MATGSALAALNNSTLPPFRLFRGWRTAIHRFSRGAPAKKSVAVTGGGPLADDPAPPDSESLR
jgi:hypothetical protein